MPELPPPRQPIAPAKRVRILVIHGMGEENPYETLNQFARGLDDEINAAKPEAAYVIKAEWKQRGEIPRTTREHGPRRNSVSPQAKSRRATRIPSRILLVPDHQGQAPKTSTSSAT